MRKIIFLIFIFCSIPVFSQSRFLWTTGANQQGSNIRSIPYNTARTEISRIYDQYEYFYFDRKHPNNYRSRADYRRDIQNDTENYRMRNEQSFINHNLWIIHWLDNNRNFIFAVSGSGIMVTVTIVYGDEVLSMAFANFDRGHAFPTNNNNKRVLFSILNDYIE